MPRVSRALLLFPCLAWGIYLGSLDLVSAYLLVAILVGLGALWLYLAWRGRALLDWIFVPLMICSALLLGYVSALPAQAWRVSREGQFRGEIYQVQELRFDQRVLVRLERSRQKVALHLPLEPKVETGSLIDFSGTIQQPKQAPNPGVFDYRTYLRGLGVFGVCYPDAYEIEPKRTDGFLTRFRHRLRDNISSQLRDPGLVLALVLGQRDQLGERQETWRILGVSHLLAISGMHVGLVAMGLGLLIKRLPLRPLCRLIVVQGILLAYIVVAGSGASAWRALLVSTLGAYGAFRGQRQDPLHLWATVGWLLLLIKPALVFDLGFTLSFAASGGILLWGPSLRVNCRNRVLRYIANSLLVSTWAQLSLAPFLFAHFGEMALLGSLATLLFVPLVTVLLIGGFFVALGLGSLGLGALLGGVMSMIDSLEVMLLPFAVPLRLGSWTLPELYLCWIFFLYAGWQLRRPRLTKPKRTLAKLTTIGVVLLTILSLPPMFRRPLEITAVNVGQGDCYFVRTPSGVHLLVDGGGDSPYWQEKGRNVGKERVVPYLQHRQVDRIDYVLISHPHEDHLFGLLAVLEHFEVGMVIDNGHEHTSLTYERYLELIEERQIPYHQGRAGDSLSLGDGIRLEILYPTELRQNLPSPYNNNSLLLRLEYGGMRMLFTGDLENPVLYDLAHDGKLDLRADWLKVPHHGSRGSLLQEFYAETRPKWAVISTGQNSFGHPHQEVTDYLSEQSIVWRTTQDQAQTFHVWWGMWGRFRSP